MELLFVLCELIKVGNENIYLTHYREKKVLKYFTVKPSKRCILFIHQSIKIENFMLLTDISNILCYDESIDKKKIQKLHCMHGQEKEGCEAEWEMRMKRK